MPTGKYQGYTGDTLVHMADGSRKYMRDLEPGDMIRFKDGDGADTVIHVIQFEFDGFISLLAPGITTTRFTPYMDPDYGFITPRKPHDKPTLYYNGPLYHFRTEWDMDVDTLNRPLMMGSGPSTPGMYAFNASIGHAIVNPEQQDAFSEAQNELGYDIGQIVLPGVWRDPPGEVSKRIGHAERMAAMQEPTRIPASTRTSKVQFADDVTTIQDNVPSASANTDDITIVFIDENGNPVSRLRPYQSNFQSS